MELAQGTPPGEANAPACDRGAWGPLGPEALQLQQPPGTLNRDRGHRPSTAGQAASPDPPPGSASPCLASAGPAATLKPCRDAWPAVPPSSRLRLGECDVLLLGTIPGFVADGERVRQAAAQHAPQAIALGVPPEDLEVLEALSSQASELMEPDALTERFLETLKGFGPVQIPSPDLEAAHRLAKQAQIPLLALDMDDASHAELYTASVRFHHVLRSNSRYKRLLKRGLRAKPEDAYAFAKAWDLATLPTASLRAVEAMREATMAARLRDEAKGRARMLAVVPAARFDGVVAQLA